MNDLKKIEEQIEIFLKKKGSNFNLESLIHFMIQKLNSAAASEEQNAEFENILIVNYYL